MKRAVSVSLGSPARDKKVAATFHVKQAAN